MRDSSLRLGLLFVSLLIVLGIKQLHPWDPPGATLSAADIAHTVGGYYGDSHPRIIRAKPDQGDPPPHDPMYHMTLSGRFHQGARRATYLDFEALADRPYAWGIFASDNRHHRVWGQQQLSWGNL